MLSVIDKALVKGHRWTALLQSMRAEGVYTIDVEHFRDIYTITSTASRLNTEPGRDRVYKVQSDKQNLRISILVSKREPSMS